MLLREIKSSGLNTGCLEYLAVPAETLQGIVHCVEAVRADDVAVSDVDEVE
jgi:hypothetical protein